MKSSHGTARATIFHLPLSTKIGRELHRNHHRLGEGEDERVTLISFGLGKWLPMMEPCR